MKKNEMIEIIAENAGDRLSQSCKRKIMQEVEYERIKDLFNYAIRHNLRENWMFVYRIITGDV